MDHKELEVWKKSIELVKNVYQITNSFPKEEVYGIISQIRRAAISIPSKELGYLENELITLIDIE
ncbi:hypothetical protein JCM13304A_09310 [Desulfothermus okinawensis JCM 13304]